MNFFFLILNLPFKELWRFFFLLQLTSCDLVLWHHLWWQKRGVFCHYTKLPVLYNGYLTENCSAWISLSACGECPPFSKCCYKMNKNNHDLFLMSCCQQCCVAVGSVRGERHKAVGEPWKTLVECASSCSHKNIKELSFILIDIRKVLVSRGHLGVWCFVFINWWFIIVCILQKWELTLR